MLGAEPGVPSARNAVQVAMNRQWMHGHWWANDPDSMILREAQTDLTPDEARLLVEITALSGGIASFSDPPALLSGERRQWLHRALSARPPHGCRVVTL
ncbi:MAG TPA: hypothetical protein VD902_07030 [Symbiobacteriaceae bacterium]|nr:hypothetical protein [Symbiobacteriaceae bacterium]